MDFIRRRLIWERTISRADLVERFGISPNQATADLRQFQAVHPGATTYDPQGKTYRASQALHPDPDDTALLLRDMRLLCEGVLMPSRGPLAHWPAIGTAETPGRPVAGAVVAAVLAAAREARVLSAVYQSFSAPRPRRRLLEPHAFIFDGFRWHARAHDVEDGAFKDFVLGRLSKPAVKGAATKTGNDDAAWTERVDLVIAPHPKLSAPQARAIAADYGMEKGRLRLTTRRATLFYVKRRLGLLTDHESRPPEEQHIILVSEDVAV